MAISDTDSTTVLPHEPLEKAETTGQEKDSSRKRSHEDFEVDNNTPETSEISGKKARHNKNSMKGKKNKKRGDLGRGEYFANRTDRRKRNEEEQAKQRENVSADGKPNLLPQPFTEEEISAEDRRPKRKVAVLVGYSGTGYKGMQINTTEKTIEGDLFTAFVEAGAISKANASDPKKSQLVRCARTDKGVHAAGNVISLKLIIEDPDIVKKINEKLNPQIRVWGIHRTTGSFNCYAFVDSRWYEYLLPTHTLIPPHPRSWLGQKLLQAAKDADDVDAYEARQADMKGFWEEVDEKKIMPLLNDVEDELRPLVEKAIWDEEARADITKNLVDATGKGAKKQDKKRDKDEQDEADVIDDSPFDVATGEQEQEHKPEMSDDQASSSSNPLHALSEDQRNRYHHHVKTLRVAYREALLEYRVTPPRLERLRRVLEMYEGTCNFHNYTIEKAYSNPSAKRHIKSFKASEPFVKHDSEWVSLKVHGQSFMMHQIRKMVGMAALVVRCGSPVSLIKDSFSNVRIAIPKAPGLGLLLERPVFDNYNEKQASQYEKETIDFSKYEEEIEAFKQREIYEQIWKVESTKGDFHSFFKHIDSWKEYEFLYVTSLGVEAVRGTVAERKGPSEKKKRKREIEDEDEIGREQGAAANVQADGQNSAIDVQPTSDW